MVDWVCRLQSPVHSPAPPPDSPEPEPKKVRPRSAKRRQMQRTVIETEKAQPKEEVSVDKDAQTTDNGNQTDSQLLRQYDYVSLIAFYSEALIENIDCCRCREYWLMEIVHWKVCFDSFNFDFHSWMRKWLQVIEQSIRFMFGLETESVQVQRQTSKSPYTEIRVAPRRFSLTSPSATKSVSRRARSVHNSLHSLGITMCTNPLIWLTCTSDPPFLW